MAREVDVDSPDAQLGELVRWAEAHHEHVTIRRTGKVVAELVLMTPQEADAEGPTQSWPPSWVGLLKDHPDVCDAIDEVYRDRQNHMPPPPIDFDDEGDEP
jgi:hypothetical protein